MIAGTKVALSMLLGCVIGWGILGPYAVSQSWVFRNGDTDDWQQSEAGWVLWISLSIMLGESLTSLVIVLLRQLHSVMKSPSNSQSQGGADMTVDVARNITDSPHTEMSDLRRDLDAPLLPHDSFQPDLSSDDGDDIPSAIWMVGLAASCILCVFSFSAVTKLELVWYEAALALIFALLISVLSVRALGETDFNPVSGVGKGMLF